MKNKNRRQFLKNISLASIGIGVAPNISCASTPKSKPAQNPEDCDKTTLDYYGEGPFYTQNPPTIVNNILADPNEPGTRMIISGRVHDLTCGKIIPNTIVDIWHADDAGQYDNQTYNLRGITTSNTQGFYLFETIQPGKYLNGAQFRPSHIHFKITPPGFPTLTTQLYFEGDTSIPADASASINSGTYDATGRIIPLTLNANGVLEGVWDIIINGDGIVGNNDLHINKGMVYKASPNPFADRIEIQYGVFNRSKISLQVYDEAGHQVAVLEERTLAPEKYTAVWNPESSLPKGHYFVVLKVNDLQVHYLKVQRV